jgi:hypothetical protein
MNFAFYASIFTFILIPQDSNKSCPQEADAAAELVLETLKSREQMLVRCCHSFAPAKYLRVCIILMILIYLSVKTSKRV